MKKKQYRKLHAERGEITKLRRKLEARVQKLKQAIKREALRELREVKKDKGVYKPHELRYIGPRDDIYGVPIIPKDLFMETIERVERSSRRDS